MPVTAYYVGGPLDGQSATRAGTTWSLFRDNFGAWLRTSEGNAELSRRGGPRRYYRYQPCPDRYVHLTLPLNTGSEVM
jgi:hypothetical protein